MKCVCQTRALQPRPLKPEPCAQRPRPPARPPAPRPPIAARTAAGTLRGSPLVPGGPLLPACSPPAPTALADKSSCQSAAPQGGGRLPLHCSGGCGRGGHAGIPSPAACGHPRWHSTLTASPGPASWVLTVLPASNALAGSTEVSTTFSRPSRLVWHGPGQARPGQATEARFS